MGPDAFVQKAEGEGGRWAEQQIMDFLGSRERHDRESDSIASHFNESFFSMIANHFW
jgi:hypothetical protein